MTFDEWFASEYPDSADRQGKFRMSTVRELMVAAWEAATTAERATCAEVCHREMMRLRYGTERGDEVCDIENDYRADTAKTLRDAIRTGASHG